MIRRASYVFLGALLLLLLLSCSMEGIFSDSSGSSDSNSGSAPAAPTELTSSLGEMQVTIQWKAVAGASSYNLYWSETRGVTPATGRKIADIKSPYIHTGLTVGASYYYVVTAVNAFGESGRSEEITVTLNDAPSPPAGISAAGGEGRIVISWNLVDKATAYSIYWSNQPGLQAGGGNRIANATSPYTHDGLVNGSSYYYVVTALNDYGESGASGEASAIPRTDPGNARLRVAWIQDMGDGGDPFGGGGNLRLMGLDTVDGRGERVILGSLGNYAKPLITPRGDRVVYSDRIRKKVYVVNWDGSGLRELFGGIGVAVWRDPGDGREWVYYGLTETKEEHVPAVYRTLLDNPGSGELVWNKTLTSVDSFQVSADGRMAGGNFPWPDGGVAQLPNQSWIKLGRGCWGSLAPDNSYAFWILDNAHRNLFIDDISGEQGRWVNINDAPGIDGYEVYHPRWSNHPRVMAMTGPYKEGSGENRIAAGGRGVEIYVGRFNAGYTDIESWWRVTNNDLGDFFPDVWLSP